MIIPSSSNVDFVFQYVLYVRYVRYVRVPYLRQQVSNRLCIPFWTALQINDRYIDVCMSSVVSNVCDFICLQNHFRITFKANSAVNDNSKSMFDVLVSFDKKITLSCILIISLKSLHLFNSLMIQFLLQIMCSSYLSFYFLYNGLEK